MSEYTRHNLRPEDLHYVSNDPFFRLFLLKLYNIITCDTRQCFVYFIIHLHFFLEFPFFFLLSKYLLGLQYTVFLL